MQRKKKEKKTFATESLNFPMVMCAVTYAFFHEIHTLMRFTCLPPSPSLFNSLRKIKRRQMFVRCLTFFILSTLHRRHTFHTIWWFSQVFIIIIISVLLVKLESTKGGKRRQREKEREKHNPQNRKRKLILLQGDKS